MENIDLLVKSLNKLENFTAKYIYNKYISLNTTPESIEQPITNFKYSKKPINKEEYKLYLDRIFSKERKHIIKQNDVLSKDLENMTFADEEYEKNPEKFKRQIYKSYPDIKRCTYIRKYKHKLIRCKNSIINDDEDICSRHETTPNIYWDMYIELLEKNNTTTTPTTTPTPPTQPTPPTSV